MVRGAADGSLADFQSRAESKLRGATDLIGKPFLLIEVAVKTLTLILLATTARSLPTQMNQRLRHENSGG